METLKAQLTRYFDQLDSDVQFSYMQVKKDTRKGTIHALRISLKRLQAFIQMWGAVDPHFSGKAAIKRFRALFMEAGRLRDLQIENSLLTAKENKLELNHKTSDQVAQLLKEQRRVFREFEDAYSMAGLRETCKQVHTHMERLGCPCLRVGLRKYFKSLLRELSKLAREGMRSKKRLHELRRRIKEAQYNLIAIDTVTPDIKLPMDLLKPMENLQNKLGKWRDHCITVDESKNLWDVPQSLRRQLRQDQAQLLQEIRDHLSELPDQCDHLWKELDSILAFQQMEAEPVNNSN